MSLEQPRLFRRELSLAARAFRSALVDQLGALGVHPGQNFLIDELREQSPLTPGQLARRMQIEVPTAVRMIQRMEAAGVLRREDDPADGRRVLISLTREGRRVARLLPRRLDTVSERALRGFSDAERQLLIDLLGRITANLTPPPPGAG